MLRNTDNVVNAVRYTVRTRQHWVKFVEENGITRDQIADVAREVAALAYPNDEPVQKIDGVRTRYGNAVQAAGNALRNVLPKDGDTAEADYLKKVIVAAQTAHDKGEISTDTILKAVTDALKS